MSPRQGKAVRLLQVTDPHLFADEALTLYGVTTAVSFRRVLAEALSGVAPRPEAILVTGDIADDHSEGAYRNLVRALQPYDLPVFCVPGNHDAPELMHQTLGAAGFQCGGDAAFGAWRAVFLDTHVPGRPEGRLVEQELLRLEQALRSHGDTPVMVCLHHPPLPVGSAWLDGVGLRNGAALLSVIDRFPSVRLILGGHVHQAFEATHGNALVLATPSTCAQFTPRTERCVMDLKPPGYRWLELRSDGTVHTEVRWLQDWVVTERPPDDRF